MDIRTDEVGVVIDSMTELELIHQGGEIFDEKYPEENVENFHRALPINRIWDCVENLLNNIHETNDDPDYPLEQFEIDVSLNEYQTHMACFALQLVIERSNEFDSRLARDVFEDLNVAYGLSAEHAIEAGGQGYVSYN